MTKAQKRANFKRIAPKRLTECVRALNRLQNLSNSSFYEYDSRDIEFIIATLEREIQSTRQILQGIRKGKFEL